MISFPHNIEYKDFHINGREIILDVARSEFFEVESVVLDLLKYGKNCSWDAVLNTLTRRYLKQEIDNAIQKVTDWRKKGFFPDKNNGTLPCREFDVSGLVFDTVFDCNLRCRYCYARNYPKDNGYMKTDLARKSIDFFLNYSADARYIKICLSGGEPLLNFPTIKEILLYAEKRFRKSKKKLVFELFTNGTLLNKPMIDFFRKCGVKIRLSIDGPGKIHDLHRPFKDGKGSFRQIQKVIPWLLKYMKEDVCAICVLSPFSPPPLELYRYFLKLGFSAFTMQPSLYSFERKFAFKDADLRKLEIQLPKMIKEYAKDFEQGKTSSLYFLGRIFKATSRGCGFGRDVITITPTGQIWACHRKFISDDTFWLGNIKKGIDPNIQRYYLKHTSQTSPICKECWTRYFCKGGCVFENLYRKGDRDIPPEQFCRYIQLMVKSGLELILSLKATRQREFVANFSRRYP